MNGIRRFVPVRGPAWILIGGFILAFFGAAGTVLATWSSREVALREWQDRLTSVSRMLSAHADQSIGAADLVLRGLAENVNDYRVHDDDEMRWVFGSRHTFEMLRDVAKGLPQIEVVTVAARDGTVLNYTREYPPAPINLLDRDYFQAHLADPSLEVYLSKPVQNRGNGKWTFYLARKIRSPGGEMLGLVLTGVSANFFSDFYESVGLGVSRVTLLREDGAILSRHSLFESSPDDQPEPPVLLDRIKKQRYGAMLLSQDAEQPRAFTEMVAFGTSAGLPLAISVAASREQLLREWESEAVKFVIEGGAMTGILIAATMLLSRLISQLETARNDALGAVEAKTRFASNVSHELRTPMNVIIGGSHQLLQTDMTPDGQKYASLVSSAAQQLMVLINDILDFSYYEARNFRIEPAPFDVRVMAEAAIAMARSLVSDNPVAMSCTIADRVPHMLLGDAGRIKQVLLNLLGNAVKYTERGSVRLGVDYLLLEGAPGQLVITVSDTGRGIADDDQLRIFQPFERGRASASRPGTGLGLTISSKLVEAMSGSISVESRLGQGSVFHIQLPAPEIALAAKAIERQSGEETRAKAHARRLNVLIAEDVAPSRVLLTIMLEKMGHHVVAVENGREAVEKAREIDFDLVLMDLQMPELDGLTATRMIRAMGGPKGHTHIIAVSANADLEGPKGLGASGFDDTLLKPVSPARLEFVVAEVAAAV